MCLVALAIDQSRRFPLVIAANRDEYFDRPTQRLSWWSPGPNLPDILGGRDLRAGGTWLGLTAAGRFAMLTNVRHAGAPDPQAPSRGEVVPLWLRGDLPMERFWPRMALAGYNACNVIAADFQQGECFWAGTEDTFPMRLQRGLFGLSNASLDTPWPKVTALKTRVGLAIDAAESIDGLVSDLFEALAEPHVYADETLPSTGVPREVERALSSAFIRMPQQGYGTRCSTLIVTERVGKRLATHVLERSFASGSALALLRNVTLRDWPPRYTLPSADQTVVQADVMDGDLPSAAPTQRRRRSLLTTDTQLVSAAGKRRNQTQV